MTESMYNNELRTFIHSRDWPLKVKFEVVEFEDCLKIKLFRDNINALDGEDKLQLAKVLNDTLWKIRNTGIPIFTWVEKGDGRGERV